MWGLYRAHYPNVEGVLYHQRLCIGSDGEVASVGLFSEAALHEIETVLLDYQSRTSG